jgi:hypothetical protein
MCQGNQAASGRSEIERKAGRVGSGEWWRLLSSIGWSGQLGVPIKAELAPGGQI